MIDCHMCSPCTTLCVLAVKSCFSRTTQLRSSSPGHSSGRLAAVFVLRLNVPNVFALIPQSPFCVAIKSAHFTINFSMTSRDPKCPKRSRNYQAYRTHIFLDCPRGRQPQDTPFFQDFWVAGRPSAVIGPRQITTYPPPMCTSRSRNRETKKDPAKWARRVH